MQPVHQRVLLRCTGDRLAPIEPSAWESFCRGERALSDIVVNPTLARRDRVDVLLVTLRRDSGSREDIPESVEPLRLGLDEHGYLQRVHLDLAPLVAPLGTPEVLDLRPRLVGRYLQRTWQWTPSHDLVHTALTLCTQPHRHEDHA